MDDYLREKFFRAINVGDVDQEAASKELSSIVMQYNRRHRHYHDLRHVYRLLKLCDDLEISDPYIVLATFYHDVIYRPGSLKNEEKSAAWARASLEKMGLVPDRVGQVCNMILATSNHLIPQNDPQIQIFLDLDMSILGASRKEYQAYADGVRKEYPWLPGFVFRKNRRQFLEKVLAADFIFHSEMFRERFEMPAKQNIEWELGL
jgi:predicted metal-dependent HD superfamily phosphohydrolase